MTTDIKKLELELIALLAYKRAHAENIFSGTHPTEEMIAAATAIRAFARELEEVLATNGVEVPF